MATDINSIIANLLSFYPFDHQTIISVGAGGGQFIEYARIAQKVSAVDNDAEALSRLHDRLIQTGLADKFTLIHAGFELLNLSGDVVLFEFCLHEMADPEASIKQALTMAPAVVISDHAPGSAWAFYAGEEQKVANSWKAIEKFPLKRHQIYESFQHFADYEELYQKVHAQGDVAITRISKFAHLTHFQIPMSYSFVLI